MFQMYGVFSNQRKKSMKNVGYFVGVFFQPDVYQMFAFVIYYELFNW